MSTVFSDISMSFGAFVAGPNVRLDEPLAAIAERIHEWLNNLASWREPLDLLSGGERGPEADMVRATQARTGATVMGRRMLHPAAGAWGDAPDRTVG